MDLFFALFFLTVSIHWEAGVQSSAPAASMWTTVFVGLVFIKFAWQEGYTGKEALKTFPFPSFLASLLSTTSIAIVPPKE